MMLKAPFDLDTVQTKPDAAYRLIRAKYEEIRARQLEIEAEIERHPQGVTGFSWEYINRKTELNYRVKHYREILDMLKEAPPIA